ncbi:MAG TPA: hypothetical protein VK787_08960, partial [Puia sp.]|nr:hypothetical protein [Puia sp.]
KSSSEHLKQTEVSVVVLIMQNIFSPMQKHKPLSHFISSVTFDKDKQKILMNSLFIGSNF